MFRMESMAQEEVVSANFEAGRAKPVKIRYFLPYGFPVRFSVDTEFG